MIVIFVHGWSATHTNTYGELPQWLERQSNEGKLKIQVGNIYLGRYISFVDSITIDDIARAFDHAVRDEIADQLREGKRFACIAHSTGGIVVRKWMDLYFKNNLAKCPLSHLIMLAPANHGSALAQLGKSRLGRIKSFFEGIEPGQRVLDWLELGSDMSWQLNESWLDYDCSAHGIYSFVLTGQKIDRQLYDAINSYTGEAGSDGVVRVTAANMNYSLLKLHQEGTNGENLVVAKMTRTQRMAFGVLPGCSHIGKHMGIIRSITMANAATHPTAIWVMRCLQVKSRESYNTLAKELDKLTEETQNNEHIERVKTLVFNREYITNRYSMIIFRLIDDRGNHLEDYDLYLTAGPQYSENALPSGFFADRQRNQRNRGKLTYFLDYDIMETGINTPQMQGNLGFRIKAHPEASDQALAYYRVLDFHSSLADINKILHPNETVMVEIMLQRRVDRIVSRITNDLTPAKISRKPTGQKVD
ncbi:phospholipase PlaB [Legionella bononiensis]|uniref:Phospholipase n=1 Tax=Legionella bononiensis TaxID=2793102 RepID=A0ABS1W7N4_9GAMM|nr:phospholipase [Legionella bononiensis]MBL7480114.1 phospholipase [Legionella bononiensis]MBL7525371.1 phospholipase [Legionella bononiensis]MBL7561555.1 phospholipase [Legionella bononiensis]